MRQSHKSLDGKPEIPSLTRIFPPLQFNVENLTNNVYKVSQESAFSPGEYFHPTFVSGSMKIRF